MFCERRGRDGILLLMGFVGYWMMNCLKDEFYSSSTVENLSWRLEDQDCLFGVGVLCYIVEI